MSQPSETDTRNIHQRLHAVMEEVDYIQKERKEGMKYTIVSHDAVTAKVRPVLVKHRVIYYPAEMVRGQEGNRTQIDAAIRFVNIDNPTDFIDVRTCGYGIDPQDKGPGKAISYSVKYALLKALGLETGDDPDEQDIPYNPEVEEKTANGQISQINAVKDLFALSAWWKQNQPEINTLPDNLKAKVTEAKDKRKAELQEIPQAAE